MKVGKQWGPSGVRSDLTEAAEATGVKGFFRLVNPLNRKVRFQSSWPRVIPYRYITEGRCPNDGQT